MTPAEIGMLRKEAAHRERRLVFHSDGRPMGDENMMFSYLPGTQTDSCTYSLVHGFNLARFYRTKVAQPWPSGYLEAIGDKPCDLERYIAFCRKNRYEAFWAQRMNDQHDAADSENGRRKFEDNGFKQRHPGFLIGEQKHEQPTSPDGKWRLEDFRPCPYGQWSSVDYSHCEVRERLFRSWEEVCRDYDIDGLMLDFFRHLTFFKSAAWGGQADDAELEMMTGLLRRTRKMADEVGADRGRPILLIARTPDEPRYAKGLGLDIERWMAQGTIDIWIAGGYFRLQEWETIVALGHKYGVPVWASMDESRVPPRDLHNSPEAYRARAMNMWNAGVDAIYLFNFAYTPPKPHFQLLHEIGDPAKLAYLDKMYVPDARGYESAGYWLKDGEGYSNRRESFPKRLNEGEPKATLRILIGDDVASAIVEGLEPSTTLRLQFEELKSREGLSVRLNGEELAGGKLEMQGVTFDLRPGQVAKGYNAVEVMFKPEGNTELVLVDPPLWIRYGRESRE